MDFAEKVWERLTSLPSIALVIQQIDVFIYDPLPQL